MIKDFLETIDWLVASAERTRSWLQKYNKVVITLFTLLPTAFLTTACDLGFSSPIPRDPCDLTGVSVPSANGIGVSKAANGEYIGISNGSFAFDTTPDQTRLDGDVKCQAASQFRARNIQNAQKLWEAAHKEDSSDAETLIYLEDQQVLASGHSHITLVVATTLTGPFVSLGRDNLQGAYVAQKEYNEESKLASGLKMLLLIANLGSDSSNAAAVARQIVQTAQADKTIVGIMGFPLSSYVPQAIPILQQAHLPVVSAGASSDALSGISPFFFRIVPPDAIQARVGANYAIHTLHAHTVALFYDSKDLSNNGFANDLKHNFAEFKSVTVVEEKYAVGHPEMLNALLKDAIKRHSDLLYFIGYVTSLNILLINLPSTSKLVIMGGNNFYQVQDYSIWSRPNFTRLHFTAFAYPDEWKIMCQRKSGGDCPQPSFISSYPQAFDDKSHQGSPYGYTRANSDTIISYDALNVLLMGYQLALPERQKTTLTPSQEQIGLEMISGTHTFQGISGQISFGKDGNPINKPIVLLYVNPDGFINVVPVNGIVTH